MKNELLKRVGYVSVLALSGTLAFAADQTVTGAGNAAATASSAKSALVLASRNYLIQQAVRLQGAALFGHTLDILTNDKSCIQHRAGLTETQKDGIVSALLAQGLVAKTAGDNIVGGIKAGVFPPAINEGSGCPMNPQPFTSAPGSGNGGHHSYPGGLVIHTQNNTSSSLNFFSLYTGSYGIPGAGGFPVVDHTPTAPKTDVGLSQDVMIAAPIWHDWGKMLVFQWNADGTEFTELSFGGNGVTDNYGAAGNSQTGGHHIIGIAESMARGLPVDFIITQASAHANPSNGNEYEVVNWLRAAAIIAQIDPVQGGYLVKDATGNLRLPALRALVDLTSQGQTNLLTEYQLHNLSDADFTQSGPAVTQVDLVLKQLAASFGYNSADVANYNNKYRNVIYTNLSAERLHMIFEGKGTSGVMAEVTKLKTAGII